MNGLQLANILRIAPNPVDVIVGLTDHIDFSKPILRRYDMETAVEFIKHNLDAGEGAIETERILTAVTVEFMRYELEVGDTNSDIVDVQSRFIYPYRALVLEKKLGRSMDKLELECELLTEILEFK